MSALVSLALEWWPAIAALFGAGFIYLRGRSDGAKKVEARVNKERVEAIKSKKEIDDEVDALAPADLDPRFKRWMQNDKR